MANHRSQAATSIERNADRVAAALARVSSGAAQVRAAGGERVGVHAPRAGRVRGCVFWRAAVDAGWLHLGECEHHTPGDDYCERWGIRGAHGNAAAYAVRHLGKCVAPEALDVPYLSAVVTVRRLRELERRYGKRTAEARSKAWRVGVGG